MAMSKKRRWLLFGVVGPFSLIALLLLVVPYDAVLKQQFTAMQTEARKAGILLDLQNLHFKLPAHLAVEGLGIQIQQPNFYLPLFIDRGEFHLGLISAIAGRPYLESHLEGYQGTLDATTRVIPKENRNEIEAKLKDLQLSEHPTLKFFGANGRLSAELKTVVNTAPPVTLRSIDGRLDVILRDGELKQSIPITPLFAIPPATKVAFDASVNRRADKVEIERLALRSSLGKGAGKGYLLLDTRGRVIGMDIQAIVNLTEDGHRSVGGYLALAANQSLDTPNRKWVIELSQQPGYALQSVVKPKP